MTKPHSAIVTICNQRGLHARAAAKFVKTAMSFDAEVEVERNGTSVSARSIMGLMMLAAALGTNMSISSSGNEGEKALAALVDLVERGFDEN